MPQKGNALLIILLILVIFVGASGYYLYTKGAFSGMMPQSQTAQSDVFNYGNTASTQTLSATPTPADEVGNVSSNNISLNVSYPSDGATLSSTTLTVTGKTSPGADIFVNDQSAKADASGNFSVKVTLDEGQNGLVVMANDASGSVAERDLSVNVQTF